jgi:pyridoxal phosphate enzyme (YggS family)
MSVAENIKHLLKEIPSHVKLVVVTKTHPVEILQEAYQSGHRLFGENRVQEMVQKHTLLPNDIEWHLIGHLQTNKVKDIAPFVSLIQSVDSYKLLKEINKQAQKNNRVIDCLLQVYIASEETKFGLDFKEVETILADPDFKTLQNIRIRGLMGMASNTSDTTQIRSEFHALKSFFDKIKSAFQLPEFTCLSMGMSSDYPIAIDEGSTLIRVGSLIFGKR